MEAVARDAGTAPTTSRRTPAIVFVGFMGAGKSGAARAAAAALGTAPVDSDRELEGELGEPLEAFFDRVGEAEFRRREERLILDVLARPGTRVVALGGGALGSHAVRDALRDHLVVYIQVEPEEAWRRASGKGRPLARERRRFDELLRDRRPLYEAAADVIMPPGGRDLLGSALESIVTVRDMDRAARPRLVWAQSASAGYPVFLGRGLLAGGFAYPVEDRRFVVTDENVARHHSLPAEETIAVPPGEGEKTLARAGDVLRRLARSGARRDDVVVALGGGVVGDLAGFCAAVYQRGVRCVQVPTSLVAQVDSAYGGKTGVDLPEAKNYVGAYHHPAAVIVDPAALETLPPEEHAAGYAEVVKTALIAGGDLWSRVRHGSQPDEETILGCLRAKLAVVAEDERDEGRRQVLNLGHTVGHAIEAATGYARYRHGEAIAVGMLCALRLSGREPLRREVAELLAARGLPTTFSGASVDEVLALVERDKKAGAAGVPFVLVESPGQVTTGNLVPADELRSAVAEVHAE